MGGKKTNQSAKKIYKKNPLDPVMVDLAASTGSASAPGSSPSKINSQAKPVVDSTGSNHDEMQALQRMEKFLTLLEPWLQKQPKVSLNRIRRQLGLEKGGARKLIRGAYEAGGLAIRTPEHHPLAQSLGHTWKGPSYHVFNSNSDDFFFRGAAETFLEELDALCKLLARDRTGDEPLRIGIVSGSTTGGMIDKLCEIPWRDHLRIDSLPSSIHFYALNVSQTLQYEKLSGNANVLTFRLAHRFRQETGRKIDAFGLSTELLQTVEQSWISDLGPQTKEVLKITDPAKLKESLRQLGDQSKLASPLSLAEQEQIKSLPDKSYLDVIVTGVGSIESSLFREFCLQSGFKIDGLKSAGIVGDIAYWPVTRTGEPRRLHQPEQNAEHVFYSAVTLEVLKTMSADKRKKVILIARNGTKSSDLKTEPIYAAVGGETPYCNVLLTDQKTAHHLYTTYAPVA